MKTLRILTTDNAAEWLDVLAHCVQHDFHHLPQYHRVAEQRGEGTAHLFTWREGEYTIALPVLLRPVDEAESDGWQDATSVYGYAGPVASHERVPEVVVRNFQSALSEALRAKRVVAVFSRMHPLIAQHDLIAGIGEWKACGETLSIDLTLSEEEQAAQHNKSCRAALRKLRERGFIGFHDREKRYLAEFTEIYLETMRRVGAQGSYHFDQRYFELLTRELGDTAQLFVALCDGRVAAATLSTMCGGIVQDHLGGTRDEFLKFSPDRLVVDTERRWAAQAGARVFHLGGGVGAQRDSVFQYKSGFSKRTHRFCTWRWIVDAAAYEEICASKGHWNHAIGLDPISGDYFPAYRCPTAPVQPRVEVVSESTTRVLTTRQAGEWQRVIERAVQHDFYFPPGYHALAEQRGEGSALLVVHEQAGYTLSLPLLLRPVDENDPHGWQDATSVYGYAGPLASHAHVPEAIVRGFHATIADALAERRVIAAFSRLHPLIPQRELLAAIGEFRPNGHTVAIDLTLSAESQWAQFAPTCRWRINRLRREGTLCLRDGEKKNLPEFVEIYHETMRRVNAQRSYFFDASYFTALADGLGDKLQLFVAMSGERIAAGGLFTICDGIVQYHLGGTRDEFLKLSPTGLMFDTVRQWAKEKGAHTLHLGGGVGSREDSLFHFKAGFSDRRHDFATWRWIVLPEIYRELCDRRKLANQALGIESPPSDFFPAYRDSTIPASEPRAVEACRPGQEMACETLEAGNTSEENKVIVIGAGGHAKEVISTVNACGREVLAVDDDPEKWGSDVLGVEVSALDEKCGNGAIIAIGNNGRRKDRARSLSFRWETIVHPVAWVAPSAKLGQGTVVFAGAIIQPDVVIGEHVIVNTGATISHDCVVGDFAHIAPGAHLAGGVQIGEGALIGIGSSLIPQVNVGAWTTVGAGAAVIGNLPEHVVAVGVPARINKS